MAKFTRRQFLEDSLLAAAAMAVSPGGKLLAAETEKQSSSPNEKLSVAVVGVNGRGNDHLKAFTSRKDTEVTYIVDADEDVGQKKAEEIAQVQGRKPKYVQDLRKMLEDKTVDIVTTATPNHWHALVSIWSLQAGKNVFVEKPVSYTVSEGRRIVETARKHNKLCQAGTQSRSADATVEAIAYIHSGKLGEVKLARGICFRPRPSIGPIGVYQVPKSVNYDLWSGPAPILPVTRKKFHYDWHWQWPYGCGDLGNQGIHQMDDARWGLGETTLSKRVFSYGGRYGYEDAGETPNTQIVVHEFEDGKTLVFEVRGLKTAPIKGAGVGVIFYGSEGYLVMTASYNKCTAFDLKGNVVKEFNGGGNHYDNFVKAVRSGKKEDLHADILEGHISSALCHTGNISYLLGQDMTGAELKSKLATMKSNDDAVETFERVTAHLIENGVKIENTKFHVGAEIIGDPVKETFPGNEAANKLVTREYRKPFVVPAASEV